MTQSKRYFLSIIVLAAILRSINIFSPLIGDNSWRQTDTAAIARNYYENGFQFLYPQIDWGGDSEGYVETEFPLYPFLISLFYKFFGVHEFIGRMLSVIFSLITLWGAFHIVKSIIDERTALWTILFLAILPQNVFFSRNYFPEPMLIMSITLGVLFFIRWYYSDRWSDFLLSLIFITLACLIKIPTLYIGLPLAFISYKKYGIACIKEKKLYLFAFLVFVFVGLWYYHAHNIFKSSGLSFGIWEYGQDKWGNWQLVRTWNFWNSIIFRILAEKHLTWAAFPIFCFGLFLKRKNTLELLFDFWAIAFIVYIIIVAKGNYVHSYYQLPFVFVWCTFIAKVYSNYFYTESSNKTAKSILLFLFVGVLALSGWRLSQLLSKENISESPEYELSSVMKKFIPTEERIVVIDGNDPTILYLAHRKGWHASPIDLTAHNLKKFAKKETTYVAGLFKFIPREQKEDFSYLLDQTDILAKNDRLFVIKLYKTNEAQ